MRVSESRASAEAQADGNGHAYTYDAAGRVACVGATGANCQNAAVSYVYNALGQRVEKLVGGGAAKYYLHNLSGRAVTRPGPSGNWLRGAVNAAGRPLATYNNGTTYFGYADWLGTKRVEATATGGPFETCASLPYGDELTCSGPEGVLDPNAASPLHFTGQHHDDETGLDHFPARNYTSGWGRWMTPDWSASPASVPYASFQNPQTLDLYDYGLGNPATNGDADGHWCILGRFGTTCPPKQPAKSADPTHPINQLSLQEEAWAALAALAAGPVRAAELAAPVGRVVIKAGVGDALEVATGVGVIVALTINQTGADPVLLYRARLWGKPGPANGKGTNPSSSPPADPSQPPGPRWQWRGTGAPGSPRGSLVNPETGETLHPDLRHGPPFGPHWDYTNGAGQDFRIGPGGVSVPK